MDDLEKSMRELARTSVVNNAVAQAAQAEHYRPDRPKISGLTQYQQPTPARDKTRMMDEVNDTYEKQIAQLRGQIGRLSTYIDRLIGPRPEEAGQIKDDTKTRPALYRTLENNADFSVAIRELTSEIERLDSI